MKIMSKKDNFKDTINRMLVGNGQFREIVGVLRRKIFAIFARWLRCRIDCETHYFAKSLGR